MTVKEIIDKLGEYNSEAKINVVVDGFARNTGQNVKRVCNAQLLGQPRRVSRFQQKNEVVDVGLTRPDSSVIDHQFPLFIGQLLAQNRHLLGSEQTA